jgi:BirA family biotin operon repressor/biotin-[acetyl-CoA-carboxylase] ligase
MARARTGETEGLWIRAGRQLRGRGRQGRAWTSDPGNVSASTLIRLRPSDPPAPTLALVAAVALHETMGVVAPDLYVRIKWPNDLMVAGAKISGILLERAEDAVVIGFGVNLASAPALRDRSTTSVAASTGTAPDPAGFVEILAEVVVRWIEGWRQQGLDIVRRAWLARAHATGTALQVRTADGDSVDGLFDGLDQDGGLLLRTGEGVRTVRAGDVFLL